MNRRDFLTVAGSASAAAVLRPPLYANATTPLYVRGLVMVSFEDPTKLRLGFPKAPGHTATLSIKPQNGSTQVLSIKGKGALGTPQTKAADFKISVPELVRMKEFYGDAVRSRIEECPTVIEIPYATIRSIVTNEVSAARYTFLRKDTGKEVASFQPRQIAESIRIDLSSPGSLRLDNGKTVIALDTAKEIRAEFLPESSAAPGPTDAFADHFHHYLMYLDRPAAARFDVVPKKLGATPVPAPAGSRSFIFPFWYCYLVAVP
jgi:hypothetical protein